jgi:hypothetical protein
MPDGMSWNISMPPQSTGKTICLTTLTGVKTTPCETALWQSSMRPVPRSRELLCGGQARGNRDRTRRYLTVIARSRKMPNSQLKAGPLRITALPVLEAGQRRSATLKKRRKRDRDPKRRRLGSMRRGRSRKPLM